MRLERIGTERLRAGGPLLVVANHPTLFDLPLLLSLMPQADCIVGAAWAENFFLRRVVVGGRLRPQRRRKQRDSGLQAPARCRALRS